MKAFGGPQAPRTSSKEGLWRRGFPAQIWESHYLSARLGPAENRQVSLYAVHLESTDMKTSPVSLTEKGRGTGIRSV